jgi:hypothetical protein
LNFHYNAVEVTPSNLEGGVTFHCGLGFITGHRQMANFIPRFSREQRCAASVEEGLIEEPQIT